MQLEAIAWNINGRANWNQKYEIPRFVVDIISNSHKIIYSHKNADIIILTEFVIAKGWNYLQEKLEKDYVLITTYTAFQNSVLIGIKKSIIEGKTNDIVCTSQINDVYSGDSIPDFLQIKLKVKKDCQEKEICVIGTRIRTTINDFRQKNEREKQELLDKDFQDRKKQFDAIVKHVKSLNVPAIIIGDFNNGNIQYERNKNQEYTNISRQFFNYQMIWRIIEDDNNWKLGTPDQGGDYTNGKFSYVSKDKSHTKEDHLICTGNSNVLMCDYNWDFITKENGYDNLKPTDYKSDLSGLPDHAILVATVEI